MSEARVRGVVVAHGGLAAALIDAVDRIVGLEEGVLLPLSNDGLSPDGIDARLAELVGNEPAIIFTDLKEGSCGMAARRLCMARKDQVLVTGANLPMLLDFALKSHLPLDELVGRVMERGRNAVQCLPERPA
jgi:mannose/fructose-specific phosphotransferase system component IIA